jgi:FMN phosphatase YigB (HAD superfamily)
MSRALYWLIDFDETLVRSGISWAFESAFPKLIAEHQLPLDSERLNLAVLMAQEKSAQDMPPQEILHELFETMGWPQHLEQPFLRDMIANYRPALFDDALLFLERLRQAGKRILLLSNNALTHKSISGLGIEPYLDAVYTPALFPGVPGKPHPDFWTRIQAADSAIHAGNTVMVGDDPWSDGLFAQNCGLACWIVDRLDRLAEVSQGKPYTRVRSLLDIDVFSHEQGG